MVFPPGNSHEPPVSGEREAHSRAGTSEGKRFVEGKLPDGGPHAQRPFSLVRGSYLAPLMGAKLRFAGGVSVGTGQDHGPK